MIAHSFIGLLTFCGGNNSDAFTLLVYKLYKTYFVQISLLLSYVLKEGRNFKILSVLENTNISGPTSPIS